MTGRRFPAPWTVEEYRGISYIVRDANNFAVAYAYLASGSAHTRYLMTKDEARKIAANKRVLSYDLGCHDLPLKSTLPHQYREAGP
jgi:hypothetical protein